MKKMIAIAFLALMITFSAAFPASLGENYTTATIINGTNFLYKIANGTGALLSIYYAPFSITNSSGGISLLNVSTTSTLPVPFGAAINNDTTKIWFVANLFDTCGAGAPYYTHYGIYYYDLLSHTLSGAINPYSICAGATPSYDAGTVLTLTNDSKILFGQGSHWTSGATGAANYSTTSWYYTNSTFGGYTTYFNCNAWGTGCGQHSQRFYVNGTNIYSGYVPSTYAQFTQNTHNTTTSDNYTIIAQTSSSGVGLKTAPFYYTVGGNTKYLYSTDKDGNAEIYTAPVDNFAAATRLTTTAANETIISTYQTLYGTVYIIYSDKGIAEGYTTASRIATFYVTTYCPSTNEMNTACDGETGYGGAYEGGGSNFSFNETNKPSNLYLQIQDHARCFSGCEGYAIFNEDWITVTFLVDGVTIPNSTCFIAGGFSNPDMVYNNPNNPFNATGKWSYNDVADAGNMIGVGCWNGLNASEYIQAYFKVEETHSPSLTWDLKAGYQNQYDDVIDYGQKPVSVKALYSKYANTSHSVDCYTSIGADGNKYMGTSNLYVDGNSKFYERMYDYNGVQTAGFMPYSAICGTWLYDGRREDTVSEMRTLTVNDVCGGQYTTSYLTAEYYVTGTQWDNKTFYYGQKPDLWMKYVNPNSTIWDSGEVWGNYPDAICSYNITYPDGTIIKSGYQYQKEDGSANIHITLQNYTNGYLANGSYNVSVSCDANNAQMCLTTATFTDNFTINNNSCLGTPNSCGIGSCVICPSHNIECETGMNLTSQDGCDNQVCTQNMGKIQGGVTLDSPLCSLYGVKLTMDKNNVLPCKPLDNVKFSATIYKGNVVVDNSVLNSICKFSIQKTSIFGKVVVTPTPMDWNSKNRDFEYTLNNYTALGCDDNYIAYAHCDSESFVIPHTDKLEFVIGEAGVYCADGTLQNSCSVTQPLYCISNGLLINNSVVCGCPYGQKVNTTPWANAFNETRCSGSTGYNYSNEDIRNFLLSIVGNPWLFLVIILIVIFIFKTQRIEYTGGQPPKAQ